MQAIPSRIDEQAHDAQEIHPFLTPRGNVYRNLSPGQLVAQALCRGEGRLDDSGALVVTTGPHTGRSPKDKYIVRDPAVAQDVWWGDVNGSMEPDQFARLHGRVLAYLNSRDLFVLDCAAGADPAHRMGVRVVTETAWHNLFARNLFIPDPEAHSSPVAPFTVLHAPGFCADPALDGTRSGAFVAISFAQRLVLIGGTYYAGEIKKSIFTVLNYLLPQAGLLTMHCSANASIENREDVALFFGLSGTGKTTLSTDPQRELIGDDEHAWSDAGVFNLEGGCYAKTIHLSPESEPEIFGASQRFGTVLENVCFHPGGGRVNFDDDSLTENGRAAYPIGYIANAAAQSTGTHPANIIMLTADAFGVLPPIARLDSESAVYHFLSGYTAKVAGTEKGVSEPQATFSACFGAPFMVLHPTVYAELLRQKIERHGVKVWLLNTGWSGGPYGVGERISLAHTRALVRAALAGDLDDVGYRADAVFGLAVPRSCPGVPAHVLDPRGTWADPAAYDAQAQRLLEMFRRNFAQFADSPVSGTEERALVS